MALFERPEESKVLRPPLVGNQSLIEAYSLGLPLVKDLLVYEPKDSLPLGEMPPYVAVGVPESVWRYLTAIYTAEGTILRYMAPIKELIGASSHGTNASGGSPSVPLQIELRLKAYRVLLIRGEGDAL